MRELLLQIRRTFLTGLLFLTPLLVTIWVLYVFTDRLDRFFQPLIRALLGTSIPGLGILIGLLLILLTGVIAPYYLGRRIGQAMDRFIMRVPVVRAIYGTSRQLLETLRVSQGQVFQEVVLVSFPRPGSYSIGFVTGPAAHILAHHLHADAAADEWVFVFIPNVPNPTTGFLILVPRSDLIPLNIPPQEAAKLIMSGGLLSSTPAVREAQWKPGS